MTEEIQYTIENVGGVEYLDVRLKKGINRLRGRNGAGKSSAINAIRRATGENIPIERRDGTERGRVEGPGITLSVRKVVTSRGDAEVTLSEDGPLSRLIDPQIKDTDLAARARIKALIELLDLGAKESDVDVLCGDNEFLAEWLREQMADGDDLTQMAEIVRLKSHEQARIHEREEKTAEAEATAAANSCKAILDKLGGPEHLTDVSLDTAENAREEAARLWDRAEVRCKAREDLAVMQKEVRETLGDKPDVDVTLDALKSSQKSSADAADSVVTLQRALAAAEAEKVLIDERQTVARNAHLQTLADIRRWHDQASTLDEKPDGPTRQDVERAAEEADAAKRTVEISRTSAQYREAQQRRDSQELVRTQQHVLAQTLRDTAAALPAALGRILAQGGATNLTVVGGRLHRIVDGKTLDYETRCSDGERIALALDIVAATQSGRIVSVSGDIWGALDPHNQAEFDRLAKERDIYAITEEPTSGELRVEQEDA